MQENMRIEKERKFWSKNASSYDQSIIGKYWKIYPSLLDKIVQDVETGGTVLEVATGTGLVALKIASVSDQVHAIDISPQMIDEAKKKVEETGINNVAFSVEDAYALPFGNGMFDTAICNNALHNVKQPEDALSEIRRVLKPGGGKTANSLYRRRAFHDAIKEYIKKYPEATIVNLGAGLDTTFSRVDNGRIAWYDLNLPDAIEFRKKLIPETARSRCIAKSAFDLSWFDDLDYDEKKGIYIIAGGFFTILRNQKYVNWLAAWQRGFLTAG